MVYVDKTDIICRMIENNDQCFISRPRRFGKSLLVSTLESLFSRGTEMFKGLAIEKKGSIIFSVWPGTQTSAFSDLKIA